ncbi:MAG: lipase family protein [Acidimicrobiales bacterium]
MIRSAPLATGGSLPSGTTAERVLYHSRSITGGELAVSGMVVVPGGPPPPGGFPIVSYAHGTTGLAPTCAPSLDGIAAIPDLAALVALVARRMVVVATDCQGLGTGGVHPYLVGQSEAQGVLDAARAARDLLGPATSNTVVVLGYSQGGQAAIFAGQIGRAYAPELYLAGVVAIAPVTSLTRLAPSVPSARPDPTPTPAMRSWPSRRGRRCTEGRRSARSSPALHCGGPSSSAPPAAAR